MVVEARISCNDGHGSLLREIVPLLRVILAFVHLYRRG